MKIKEPEIIYIVEYDESNKELPSTLANYNKTIFATKKERIVLTLEEYKQLINNKNGSM